MIFLGPNFSIIFDGPILFKLGSWICVSILTRLAFYDRQKRKLDDMYDRLRSEYESMKRSAIQPASNFYPRSEPDLFSAPANMMNDPDNMRKGNSLYFSRMQDTTWLLNTNMVEGVRSNAGL